MSEQYCEASPLAVSEHEEYIWMLQLQQPEQIVQHFELYKFDAEPELSLLKMSIRNVIEQHPDLNSRFIFSEDGNLNKTIDSSFDLGIQTLATDTNQLEQRLSYFKNKPWNAETDPPLNALIIQTEQDILLALCLHPILEESYQLNDIIEEIKNNYNKNQTNSIQLQTILLETSEQAENSLPPISNDQNHDQKASNTLSQNEICQIILTEFKNILAEPEMTAEDDFFDFGGHSLLATRVIGYLQNRHGIELSFNDFFKSPTASALAQYASLKNATTQQNSHVKLEQAPLTFTQDFLWQAYSAFDFSPIYNLPFAIEFQDQIDEEIFFQAFHDLVVRHVGLRTLFKIDNEKVTQSIAPLASLNQYKWFWSSNESQGITLAEEAAYKFDLSRELPIRIRFLKNANGQQTLSFLVHHMVIDEWSLNSIMSDLETAYYARLNQQTPQWDTPANSIHELAISQQKNGLNPEHIQYWKNMLQGATYGLDLKNPVTSTAQPMLEPKVEWLELKFSPETYQSISAFSRLHHSSIFSVIYTAIISSLQKTGDLKEIVIGTSASGRTDPYFFDTVGYLTTMVSHRTQFSPEQNFAQLLEKTSQMLNESMAYADIPINHIQKALGLADDDGLIFDVYIHIHSNNALNGAFKTPQGDVQYRQILPERNESMFGLHFEIMDNLINDQHQLSLIVTYQAHRYPTALVEQIGQMIQSILNELNSK